VSVDPGSRGWREHLHRLPWPLSIIGSLLDIAGGARVTGASFASSGAGMEFVYGAAPGRGDIQSYDRSANAWTDLNLMAKNVTLQPNSGGHVHPNLHYFNTAAGVAFVAVTAGVWHDLPGTTFTPVVTGTYLILIDAAWQLPANVNSVIQVGLATTPTGNGTTVFLAMVSNGVAAAGASGDTPTATVTGISSLTAGVTYCLQGYSGSGGSAIGRVIAILIG
jgi:hypothetical protein